MFLRVAEHFRSRCAISRILLPCVSLPKEFLSASHVLPRCIFWEASWLIKCKKCLILLATPAGFEPATPSLEGWCSIRLSYGVLPSARFTRAAGLLKGARRDLRS